MATVIEIHIEEGGLKKMQVTDNGVGMGRDDLEICFLPHTTSKLTEDHLLGIRTLGFRGEALSSIAAVSALSIKSRTESDHAGTLVTILNGELNEISPTGTPKGTVITVHDLFHVLPARKKFLKSVPTELRHITEVIVQYGLAYPGVHFQLTHNDKTILDLPRRDTLPERIRTLLGVSTFDQLIPLSHEDSYLKVEGFIGVPQISLKNNSHQYTFVNNRSVTDKIVASAVKEAFGSLIPSASTPVFLLYLTLPYDLVDVNIHPRKEQVAFINPKLVFDGVKMAVSETLHTHNITFNLARFKNETSARVGETTSISGKLLKYTLGEAVSRSEKSDF